MTNNELADLFEEFAQRLRGMAPMVAEPAEKVSGSLLKTEPEMATLLKVSKRHLLSLRVQRLIPFIKLGKSVRYNPEAVERAIEKLTINEIGAKRAR